MRTTSKQAAILAYIEKNPGCCTADVHRAVGRNYAHGHHAYTYESVKRLIRAGRVLQSRGPGGCKLLRLPVTFEQLDDQCPEHGCAKHRCLLSH